MGARRAPAREEEIRKILAPPARIPTLGCAGQAGAVVAVQVRTQKGPLLH